MNLLEKIKEGFKTAVLNNHRRMIVLEGDYYEQFLYKILKDIFTIVKYKNIAFLTSSPEGKIQKRIIKNLESMSERLKFNLIVKHMKDSDEIMGTTQDLLILDLTENLEPNDFGKLVEAVRGGGFIILLTPDFEEWKRKILKYHQVLITPPYTEKDVRHIFIPWFVKKLKEHDGILIVDTVRRRIEKDWGNIKEIKKERREIKIPEDTLIDRKIYEMAKTQDQVDALRSMEKILKWKKTAVVITANRGRGKSAVVGLFLAGLISEKKKIKIGVTSPDINNVQTFFEFLVKGLKELGKKPAIKKDKGKIIKVRWRKSVVEYYKPIELLKKKRIDVVFVDEAAGIPVTLLYKIYEKFDITIFATTIHGYEGAGRSFSVRFMKKLQEEPKEEMVFIRMEEPIRYSEGDPIEKFVYDSLLLDAEPAELSEEDLKLISEGKLEYLEIDPGKLFEDENILRQFVGIYILAHYRNRPNDLMLLADAPHHFPRLTLVNGKVVNSIQIAKEGGLDEEWIKRMKKGEAPSGNIIPDRVLKYYGIDEFGKEIGYRIVRIATHPKVMSKGIGSFALKKLEEEARKKKMGWIGSGFGVNYELLRFWIKNGFVPVHISPTKNEISGEYSVIVIKPLKKKIESLVKKMNKDFREKLIECLPELYCDMEPEVVRLLLKPIYEFKYKPNLTEYQLYRLKGYVDGIFTLETVLDVVKKASIWYFLNYKRFLNDYEENALIVKILQHNRWKRSQEMLGLSKPEILSLIRKAMKKIYKELTSKEEQR